MYCIDCIAWTYAHSLALAFSGFGILVQRARAPLLVGPLSRYRPCSMRIVRRQQPSFNHYCKHRNTLREVTSETLL
jgi:hypothetical protein